MLISSKQPPKFLAHRRRRPTL